MKKTDDSSTIYTINGTKDTISDILETSFGINKDEANVLTSLEIDMTLDKVSSKEEASFWLYNNEEPATLLAGKSGYSIAVTKATFDIIKKIFDYAATHVNIGEAGPTLTPEMSTVDKVMFIYDILSTIYKHLYKLEDYEWCFCFSAASYLKQTGTNHFSPEDVLNTLHQDVEHICKHIGDGNECSFHTSNDYCRLNTSTVGDVIDHLSKNNVINLFCPGYYSFVF